MSLIATPYMAPVVAGRSLGEPLLVGHMTQCLSFADDSCGRMPRQVLSFFLREVRYDGILRCIFGTEVVGHLLRSPAPEKKEALFRNSES